MKAAAVQPIKPVICQRIGPGNLQFTFMPTDGLGSDTIHSCDRTDFVPHFLVEVVHAHHTKPRTVLALAAANSSS